MSLTSYRAAPSRVKGGEIVRKDMEKTFINLVDPATTYSPAP
jgi:hypothetical protein